jgi:hypothetical protein
MSENLFESNDDFDDVDDNEQLEPTQDEVIEDNFNEGIAIARNEEHETPILESSFSLSKEDWEEVAAKAKSYDDLQERLTKTHDKAFGKIGQLEQELKELRAIKAQQFEPTPITKETFKNVTEYFADEDFAEKLASDLAGIQFGGNGTSSSELEIIRQEIASFKQESEIKILTVLHPDWKDVVNKPEFDTWQQSLSPEGKAELAALQSEKWDGLQAAKAITGFKSWEKRKADAEIKKQERLSQAVPLKGAGIATRTSTLDSEDAFNAGLENVRKSRKL